MICKNCGAKNDKKNKFCLNCGKKLTKSKFKYVIIVLIVLIIGIILISKLLPGENNPINSIIPPETINIPGLINQENTEPIDYKKDNIPLFEADYNKSDEEIDEILKNVLASGNTYYDKYWDMNTFLTRNGLYYDRSIDDYVTLKNLLDLTELNPNFVDEPVYLMYLKPDDFSKLTGETVGKGMTLELFVAYEVKDGYKIKSRVLKDALITKEEFNAIQKLYEVDLSYSDKIISSHILYKPIMKALIDDTKIKDGFDIRYFVAGEIYAVIVASPKNSPLDLKGYILEKTNSDWIVAMPDLQNYVRVYNEINDKVVNFNTNILPEYNIHFARRNLISDFTLFETEIVNQGLVSSSDGEATFKSGVSNFVFLEYAKTGKNFIACFHKDENTWVFYPVSTYEEAAIQMISLQEIDSPLYILKNEFVTK